MLRLSSLFARYDSKIEKNGSNQVRRFASILFENEFRKRKEKRKNILQIYSLTDIYC